MDAVPMLLEAYDGDIPGVITYVLWQINTARRHGCKRMVDTYVEVLNFLIKEMEDVL